MNMQAESVIGTGWQDRAAEVFKAMAHPVRVLLLEALAQEECCVCHLVFILKRRQPYISQQLMALREAGLVADRREGTVVYYRLAHPDVRQLLAVARQMSAGGASAEAPAELPHSPVAQCTCPKCASMWLVRA
jgi:DNA-binding transcriptional ArsR family regulator